MFERSKSPAPSNLSEHGNPTATRDAAAAMLALVARTPGGTWHLPSAGMASRLEWAQAVLALERPDRPTRPISRTEFQRASDPPPWGVLDGSKASGAGIMLPDWRSSLADAPADGVEALPPQAR